MKYFSILALMLLVSCSHYHKGGHQHDKLEAGISHKNTELMVTHVGKDYFFETELERDTFLKSIADEKLKSQPVIRARGRRI